MAARRRIVIAALIAFAIFAEVLAIASNWQPPVPNGDFSIPLCGANHLLQGLDPYTCNHYFDGQFWPTNPLTTILFTANFLPFGSQAGAVLFAFCSGLLAFAVTYRGSYWRLLVFLSLPFWHAMAFFQWAPLLLAVYFLPNLLPLALIKPHIGLPVILSKLTRWRLAGLVVFGLVTLVVDPTWPLRWWPQAQSYDSYIPLLHFPLGPLILLALLNRKDPRSWFLLITAAIPQHGLYDLLILFAIPATWPQMAWMVIVPRLWTLVQFDDRDWNIVAFYLPSLVIVLLPLASKLHMRMPARQPA